MSNKQVQHIWYICNQLPERYMVGYHPKRKMHQQKQDARQKNINNNAIRISMKSRFNETSKHHFLGKSNGKEIEGVYQYFFWRKKGLILQQNVRQTVAEKQDCG